MTDLAILFERLVDEPLAPLPSLEELRRRNHSRHRRARHRGAAGTVAAAVTVGLVIAFAISPSAPPTSGRGLASYLVPATKVPLPVLESVGIPSTIRLPQPLRSQPELTTGGKPEVFYAGAPFCPFCAVSRWALVVALSEFGTFTDLGSVVSSSSNEIYPGLKSWSFAHSTYTSPFLSFDPVELSRGTGTPGTATGYVPMSTLSPADRHLIDTYDTPGTIPFIDLANEQVVVGAAADPAPLEHLSLGQISSALSDPSSAVAEKLDGAANALIRSICSLVGTGAAPVCTAPFVQQTPSARTSMYASTSRSGWLASHLITRITTPGPDGSTITLKTSSPNADTGCLQLFVTAPTQAAATPITSCSSVGTATHPPTTTTPTTSFGSGAQPWTSPAGATYVIVYGQAPTGAISAKLINGPTGEVVTGDVPMNGGFYAYPVPKSLTHKRDELAFYNTAGAEIGTAAL